MAGRGRHPTAGWKDTPHSIWGSALLCFSLLFFPSYPWSIHCTASGLSHLRLPWKGWRIQEETDFQTWFWPPEKAAAPLKPSILSSCGNWIPRLPQEKEGKRTLWGRNSLTPCWHFESLQLSLPHPKLRHLSYSLHASWEGGRPPSIAACLPACLLPAMPPFPSLLFGGFWDGQKDRAEALSLFWGGHTFWALGRQAEAGRAVEVVVETRLERKGDRGWDLGSSHVLYAHAASLHSQPSFMPHRSCLPSHSATTSVYIAYVYNSFYNEPISHMHVLMPWPYWHDRWRQQPSSAEGCLVHFAEWLI